MLNQARNDAALKSMLLPKIQEVVDYVVQKIWNENRELVTTLVYESYQPTTYNRTGEFKEAWDTKTELYSLTSHVKGEFFYDPSKLTPGDSNPDSPRYGQHVSGIDGFLMTTYLAEVIYEGLAGPAFGHGITSGPWASKRDVWQQLEKSIGKRKLKQWFQEGFSYAGLKVHSHGTGFTKG